MLHTIFNPCKHIASCCFVRFRSLSATKIHNYFEKENNCVNFYALDQGTVLAMASDFVDYSDLTSSRKSSNKFGFSFDFS